MSEDEEPADCGCDVYVAHLDELVDQEMDRPLQFILGAHESSCPSCASRHEAEVHLRQEIRRCFRQSRAATPAELRRRIVLSIRQQTIAALGRRLPGTDAKG